MEEEIPDRVSACGREGKGDAEEGMVMLKGICEPEQANHVSTFLRLSMYVQYVQKH